MTRRSVWPRRFRSTRADPWHHMPQSSGDFREAKRRGREFRGVRREDGSPWEPLWVWLVCALGILAICGAFLALDAWLPQ